MKVTRKKTIELSLSEAEADELLRALDAAESFIRCLEALPASSERHDMTQAADLIGQLYTELE